MKTQDLSDEQFEDAVSQMLHRRAADIDDPIVVPIARESARPDVARPGHTGRLVFAAAAIAVVVAGLVLWTNRSTQGAITVTEEPPVPTLPEPAAPAEQALGPPAPSIVYSADGSVLFDFDSDTLLIDRPYDPDAPSVESSVEGAPVFLGAEVLGETNDTRVEVIRRVLMGCDAHVDPGLASHMQELGRSFFAKDARCALEAGESVDSQSANRFGDGLRIYTTFDPDAQAAALTAIGSTLPADPRGFGMTIVSVEPGSGAVRTLASQPGLVWFPLDVATTLPGRLPGSAYQTVVVAAALEAGYLPTDSFDGRGPCTVPAPNEPEGRFTVENFGRSPGSVNSLHMLALSSSNCGAMAVSQTVGLDAIAEVGTRLGLLGDRESGTPTLSLPLGTQAQTPLNMAVMQATLTNGGIHHAPFVIERVENAAGEVLYAHASQPTQAISADAACRTMDILVANVQAGTGTAAGSYEAGARRKLAGKTGTVEDFTNAWFVGSTQPLATAVWMGLPYTEITVNNPADRQMMVGVDGLAGVTGGSFPAEAFGAFNSSYHDVLALPEFAVCRTEPRGGRFVASGDQGQDVPQQASPSSERPPGRVIPEAEWGDHRCPDSHPIGVDTDANGLVDLCFHE